MENATMEQSDTLGAKPSIVEDFRIEGLYGYRSIGLSSKYAATILIAKNGSGKTTLLGALDAFLRGHFSRLSNLQFSSITCKLRGVDELLILKQEDIADYMSLPEVSEIHIASKKFEIEVFALLDFLENEYPSIKGDIRALRDNEVFDAIRVKLGYSTPETRRFCERLVTSLAGRNENIDRLRNVLNSVIGETEIVYLPTYRRIELPLQSDLEDSTRNSPRRKRTIQSRLGISKRSLFNADIQFGLSDISERLYNLNQEILYNSNQGYREISANIINELIGGILDNGNPGPVQRPDKESLNLFFSRIREGQYHAPYSDVAIPDIDKIYSGEDISQESNKFLTYFLSKLNTVIQATRDIEVLVEEFINNCNRYLSAQDDSTSIHSDEATAQSKSTSIDGKILILDRKNLKVNVESVAAQRKISLDTLSSGEKQMISLFARLYLYPGKKIILIDEPELSLSIDWQRKILLDVVNAPSCIQTIAITHSPFVFDNELEPYAKGLSLEIDTAARDAQVSQDEEDI